MWTRLLIQNFVKLELCRLPYKKVEAGWCHREGIQVQLSSAIWCVDNCYHLSENPRNITTWHIKCLCIFRQYTGNGQNKQGTSWVSQKSFNQIGNGRNETQRINACLFTARQNRNPHWNQETTDFWFTASPLWSRCQTLFLLWCFTLWSRGCAVTPI